MFTLYTLTDWPVAKRRLHFCHPVLSAFIGDAVILAVYALGWETFVLVSLS